MQTYKNTYQTFFLLSLWGIVCRILRKKWIESIWNKAVPSQHMQKVTRFEYSLDALYTTLAFRATEKIIKKLQPTYTV